MTRRPQPETMLVRRALQAAFLVLCAAVVPAALGQSGSPPEHDGRHLRPASPVRDAEHVLVVPGHHDAEPPEAAFVRRAREATARYHDLQAAIRAGFRLVGPDFPGMGEHWVNLRIAMRREIDPASPAVLSYLRVDGEPVLTGAAYAVPLLEGEAPPELPFVAEWHYHDGSIADETLHLDAGSPGQQPDPTTAAAGREAGDHRTSSAMGEGGAKGPRLGMIHAWIWTENPAGVFAQQNWRLALLRLGLEAEVPIGAGPGQALYLLSGGVTYYRTVLNQAAELSSTQRTSVRELLASHRNDVADIVGAGGHMLEARRVSQLDAAWDRLWSQLAETVPEAVEAISSPH